MPVEDSYDGPMMEGEVPAKQLADVVCDSGLP